MTNLFRGVHEVRVLRPGGVAVGYFDDFDAALAAVENEPKYRAAYFSLNPIKVPPEGINPVTLKASRNTAADTDIARRVRLLVDLDPERPAGTNATDAEKLTAREQAEAVRQFLSGRGWPSPCLADSGNGWHLLYQIDLPNDVESTALVRAVLTRLKHLFPLVDAGNFNASRVCKLYGSWSRKGPHTEERPHRRSAIVETGGDVVTVQQLRNLIPRALFP